MRPQPHPGFPASAVCAGVFGTIMAALVLTLDGGGIDPWETMWMRCAAGLLAALSGVAAEALWRPRPWAYRSSLALALVYAAVVTLWCLHMDGGDGVVAAFVILFVSSWLVVPIVLHVRERSATLFGPHVRHPRPAPGIPVAQPAVHGRPPQPWW